MMRAGMKQYMASMGAPPQTVAAQTASEQEWRPEQTAIGSLRAVRGVDVSNELAGIVDRIGFDSGQDVKQGMMLAHLRAEDDAAKLRSLEASAHLAEITLNRDRKQLKAEAVSQASVDNDAANLASAVAQVAQQKALLDKKTILAPFSGKLGIRQIDLGQYLTAGSAIVTLQQLDPIYLDFTLPQQALSEAKIGQPVEVRVDAYPGKAFHGVITAINPKIDPATRNLQVRASLSNPDARLLPGMYATAHLQTGVAKRFVTLPQTAISYNSYGDIVFLVEKDKDAPETAEAPAKPGQPPKTPYHAVQRFVTIGATRGDQVQVLSGVKVGDMVVVAGQMKLRGGTPVLIDNKVLPADEAAPHIRDE
jgi:membrane fusion protein (multidrug efflux system)